MLLNRDGHAVVVGDGPALEEIHAGNTRIGRRKRKHSESDLPGPREAVEVVVVIEFRKAAIAHVVHLENSVRGQHALNFQVPFHVLWVLKVAADVIQRRDRLQT